MSSDKLTKIVNFTDLDAWKKSHYLYVEIHKATRAFPPEELYGLTSQIRRAALSVTSNIAEGFGRSSDADKLHFYIMARGTLFEVQNQLMAALDIEILDRQAFDALLEQAQTAQRILIGLINSTKRRQQ